MSGLLAHVFAPFYYHGRGWFDIGADELDRLLAAGAHAEITSAGTLSITTNHIVATYRAPKHMHQRAVAAWVREFNRRAS